MLTPGVVSLLVNGWLYEGWVSVEVSRSIKEMAGQFTLKVSERWTGGHDGPASLMSWRIRPGDACTLLYDGKPVITGYVDAYNPRYNATSHDVTIQGRSKTGDLCDCSAEADLPKGELRNQKLDQIARRLTQPYGIGVKVEADVGEAFDPVRSQLGETVHEMLERYARPGAVALTDDEQGNLRLVHVKGGGAVAALIEGVNILEANATLRADNRHSDYEVKGQDHGTDKEFGRPVAQRASRAQDPAVKRHRPMRIVNETKTTRRHSKDRADWESSSRAGESVKVECQVVDWRTPGGKLWMPGDTVLLVSPMLAVERELAIESCRYKQNEGGTITTLSLVPPEALSPTGRSSGGGSNTDQAWSETKSLEAAIL